MYESRYIHTEDLMERGKRNATFHCSVNVAFHIVCRAKKRMIELKTNIKYVRNA